MKDNARISIRTSTTQTQRYIVVRCTPRHLRPLPKRPLGNFTITPRITVGLFSGLTIQNLYNLVFRDHQKPMLVLRAHQRTFTIGFTGLPTTYVGFTGLPTTYVGFTGLPTTYNVGFTGLPTNLTISSLTNKKKDSNS